MDSRTENSWSHRDQWISHSPGTMQKSSAMGLKKKTKGIEYKHVEFTCLCIEHKQHEYVH